MKTVLKALSAFLLARYAYGDCSAAGASYGSEAKAVSSLSWDCANYIGSQLVTHTVLTTETVTSTRQAIATKDVSPVWETETVTSYSTTYKTTITGYPATVTVLASTSTGYYLSPVYSLRTTTLFSAQTVMVTVGLATITAPTLATTTIEGPPVFNSNTPPMPRRFKTAEDCSGNQLSAYCSRYLNAPIPTPIKTVTLPYNRQRVEYTTVGTSTFTRTGFTLTSQVWKTASTTTKRDTVIPTSTITTGTTYIFLPDPNPTRTSVVEYLVQIKPTTTVTVSTTGTIVLSTKTVVSTPTIPVPALCKQDPSPFAASLMARYFSGGVYDGQEEWGGITKHYFANDRIQCCALCYAAENCAFYQYNVGYKDCAIRKTEIAPEAKYGGPGYVTDTCPRGQLAGDWVERVEKEYEPIIHDVYQGPCFNGWKPGVPHVRQLTREYNPCSDPNPVAFC